MLPFSVDLVQLAAQYVRREREGGRGKEGEERREREGGRGKEGEEERTEELIGYL